MNALDTMRALASTGEVITVEEGELIFTSGESGNCMFGLLEGSVELSWNEESGQEVIRAGDVFQLVLSQRLETEVSSEPFELYRSLRMVNPSPYMAFFNFGGWYLIGSSPEVMVKAEPLADGSGRVKASLRPIAGT